MRVPFEKYIDYGIVHDDKDVVRRESFLGTRERAQIQPEQSRHYEQFEDGFFNR